MSFNTDFRFPALTTILNMLNEYPDFQSPHLEKLFELDFKLDKEGI